MLVTHDGDGHHLVVRLEGGENGTCRAVPSAAVWERVSKGGAMLGNKQDFGSPINALRRRLNMTQEEFAHAIGVTVSTVNRWENGHIEPSRLARKAMEGLLAEFPNSSDLLVQPTRLNARQS